MADYQNEKNKEPLSDQKEPDIPEEELQRVLSAMIKTLDMGICAVYGEEDEEGPDADVDCDDRLHECRAACCTLQFALTKEEVRRGHIRHDERRPFFIAHDEDRYCSHLDRLTLKCTVWNERPLRCRRYDCFDDPDFRQQGKEG